jgi:hypothetical protein
VYPHTLAEFTRMHVMMGPRHMGIFDPEWHVRKDPYPPEGLLIAPPEGWEYVPPEGSIIYPS